MKIRVSVLALLAVSIFMLSGCTKNQTEKKDQNDFNQELQEIEDSGKDDGYTSDGRHYVAAGPEVPYAISYKGIGESYPSYREFTVEDSADPMVMQVGDLGLTYTLEDVTVYQSFTEAKEDAGLDAYCSDVSQADDPFILIGMTATYEAPSADKNTIITQLSGTVDGRYLENEPYPDSSNIPALSYFSLRPKSDDKELDKDHDFYAYRIQDGDSIYFQIGVTCGPEWIESKNVYLEVTSLPPVPDKITGDTTRRVFELLPEGAE